MTQSIYAALLEKKRLTDLHFVGSVERLIGRVPTNQEVALHSRVELKRDGTETYFWKGQKVLIISAQQNFGGGKVVGWEIQTLVSLETSENE